MRPKIAFSKINNKVGHFDMDKFVMNNPSLWKKLKKQFDIGLKIVQIQLVNGLKKSNEDTLRYYLMEFSSRFLKYGPNSFPTSFNVLEPFFIFNIPNSIIQLHPEEESYNVSLVDFLDFVTERNFELDKIDFYENIPENLIYNFTFSTGFDEINFSNNGKTFVIGGLSMVRQGNEVSILMQTGESFDPKQALEYFKSQSENSQKDIFTREVTQDIQFENKTEHKVVNFNDRSDLWAHNVITLFDLQKKSIDIRLVSRDENRNFKNFTDDYFVISQGLRNISNEEKKELYEIHLKELSAYDAVFDFAKYCLALPLFVFENESKIVDITYETNLNSIIKNPVSRREFSSVPPEYKIFAKPLYYLESNEQIIVKSKELRDESFKLEKSGYWKRLKFDEQGFDKNGNKIIGKTWVERNDTYYSSPIGLTKVEKVTIFENENAGYIYIMREPTHEENIFKVGLTRRTTEQRRKELSNTSSPDKFYIMTKFHTKDCIKAEKLIHDKLEIYRLTTRREFFKCDLKVIIDVCQEIINEINM